MQSRLKQLRMNFGLDRQAFADLLGCTAAEVEAWEKVQPAPATAVALVAERFDAAPEWLHGADVSIWGERIRRLQALVRAHIEDLTGPTLVRVLTATTGERIAYVMGIMQGTLPTLCTLEWMACWLGLSPESTRLLLNGSLDPGSPAVLRASDLTGVSEHWFRIGPTGH